MKEWGKYSTCPRCGAVCGEACLNMHPTFSTYSKRPEVAQVHPERPRATSEELEAQAADTNDWARRFVEDITSEIINRPSVLDVPEVKIEKTSGRKRKWIRPTASRA